MAGLLGGAVHEVACDVLDQLDLHLGEPSAAQQRTKGCEGLLGVAAFGLNLEVLG